MNSKYISTKTLEEKTGKTNPAPTSTAKESRTKGISKESLIKHSRDKFYSNLKDAYVANKDSSELPPAEKKKPANDIIRRNRAAAKAAPSKTMAPAPKKATARAGSKNPGTETVNIEVG